MALNCVTALYGCDTLCCAELTKGSASCLVSGVVRVFKYMCDIQVQWSPLHMFFLPSKLKLTSLLLCDAPALCPVLCPVLVQWH